MQFTTRQGKYARYTFTCRQTVNLEKKKKKLYESLRITFSIATRRKLFHTS